MYRLLPAIAAFSAGLAILAGAFGAHGLKESVSVESLSAWKTGAHYHLIHSVALFFSAKFLKAAPSFRALLPLYLFLGGILFFSGSLYALVLTQLKFFGPITPVGGLMFAGAWLLLGWQHIPGRNQV